jgi:hypothetical protein
MTPIFNLKASRGASEKISLLIGLLLRNIASGVGVKHPRIVLLAAHNLVIIYLTTPSAAKTKRSLFNWNEYVGKWSWPTTIPAFMWRD